MKLFIRSYSFNELIQASPQIALPAAVDRWENWTIGLRFWLGAPPAPLKVEHWDRVASFGILAEDDFAGKRKNRHERLSAAPPEIRRAAPLHVGMLRMTVICS